MVTLLVASGLRDGPGTLVNGVVAFGRCCFSGSAARTAYCQGWCGCVFATIVVPIAIHGLMRNCTSVGGRLLEP